MIEISLERRDKMRTYCNYHKHDFGSNIRTPDAVCSQEDYAKRAIEIGDTIISSVAHGWQNRYIDTYELAKQYNLHPVFGAEAYWVKDRHIKDDANCHIIILARNENGRRAINEILSQANEDGFYYQPRVDIELLLSLPSNDVVVTSACYAFWKYEDVDDIVVKLFNHFGNSFYLEVQAHNCDIQKNVNAHVISLANKYNIQLIAGVDSHYIYPDDAWERDEYLESKGIHFAESWLLDYPDGDTLYKRFVEQGVLTSAQIDEAMENTKVCETFDTEYNCNCFNTSIKMPTIYPNKTQEEKNTMFNELVWKKWEEEKQLIPIEMRSRYEEAIQSEIQVVIDTNHADYFLLNYEMIKNGVKNGGVITPSGRGSGVSFYINKLLGFTLIDRISAKVHMFPERFMSKTRILETHSLADIDFNVANQEPFAKAQEDLLGYTHSQPMIAYGTFKPKNAWRMYARAKKIDNNIAIKVSEGIEEYNKAVGFADDTSKGFINIEDYIPKEYISLFEDSKTYLGIYSDLKQSPCSYLLYQGDIRKEIGLIKTKSVSGEEHLCSIMDKAWADKYKFLKNDILKVKSVDLINRVFKRINLPMFDVNRLLELCPPTSKCWDIYSQGFTMGINQVEQPNTRVKVMRYKPKNISELCAFVAAVRPGFQSMYKVFESREQFKYDIPSFDKLIQTKEMPNSFVLYQETSMLAISYAGISMDETYGIIKNISKKKEKEIKKYKTRFISGFSKKIEEEDNKNEQEALAVANKVWEILEDSSRYSFNASHAYSMAVDSLYLAWLKTNYPLEFYETMLRMCEEDGEKDRIVKVKKEAELCFNIDCPPYRFGQDNRHIVAHTETRTITMNMGSIKHFSKDMADILYEASQHFFPGFISLLSYLQANHCSMKRVEDLIKIQYFDDFGGNGTLLSLYSSFMGGPNRISQNLKQASMVKRMAILEKEEETAGDLKVPFKDQLQYDEDILGYIQISYPINKNYYYVTEIDKRYSPKISVYNLRTGKTSVLKLYAKQFNRNNFNTHDILYVDEIVKRNKVCLVDGNFVPVNNEYEYWMSSYIKIKDIDAIINDAMQLPKW